MKILLKLQTKNGKELTELTFNHWNEWIEES